MAPTAPLPILVRSQNLSSGAHLRHLRRQGLNFSNHLLGRSGLALRTELFEARPPSGVALQPRVEALDGPSPSTIVPTSSQPVTFAPEPSAISGSEDQQDVSGNIIAAVVVVILILGGLVGLVVGGEMLRRRAKAPRGKVSLPPSRGSGCRKPRLIKNPTSKSPQQPSKTCREKYPYDEKRLTPLTRPPPVVNRERSRRLSDVWPIHTLSRVLCKRRSHADQVERLQHSEPPPPSPQTTWSEFSPVSLYVAPPRTVLACIPEELEDCQSQTNSDISATLGATLQPSLESDSAVLIPRTTELKLSMLLECFDGSGSSLTTEQRYPQDRESSYRAETGDEDTNSLISSAPEMTSDGGESSRSSTVSLESLEDGNDKESLQEEVFELRRAQTRSMQMNKGVLLSLSLKTLNDSQNPGEMDGECGPSQSPSVADAEEDCRVERELSLAILSGNLSAVSLDEFPSPPSMLPMIPSFVSGF